MLGGLARKLFGTSNERFVKSLQGSVDQINSLESQIQALTDDQLQGQTRVFRDRLAQGAPLDDLLPEAFATVREGARRVLGQRHFDVQLMGGMVLHQGKISEMKTGEGKTLVATLAVYLNALEGKGVHVVTVNDYLASRDSEWMGRVYRFLRLTVGCIVHGLDDDQRRAAYACDVTYGTNNEFGFDYLRDNMKFRLEEMVQRPFNFAIVDEVDSILIDEARTPLIISGPAEDSSDLYRAVNVLMPELADAHYEKDEKHKTVALTEAGVEFLENRLRETGLIETGGLYDVANVHVVHHTQSALRAHKLFTRDVDYIVKDDKIVIIDEFTGRMMPGRRYSEGLHQALEAKEFVTIQQENQTLASITFQNYFRMYPKLSGMTGTAMTEAAEFAEIYKLDVVEIPTNRNVARLDADDEVYRTQKEKHEAIVKLVEEARVKNQPVLVGTVSIEKSELLAELFKQRKIPHQVLNARFHEQEAQIIAQAGRPGAVTIATNMAGRGTDIQLGGNVEMRVAQETVDIADEAEKAAKEATIRAEIEAAREVVRQAGGLYVLGTERHESRRIDNQLRGRSGRQGDPGASKFYISLEDDLMRIFGSQRMDVMLQRLGLQEGEAIMHSWLNKAIERAQKKVEAQHFEVRKNLLKYDDVMNDQRKVVYEQRKDVMSAADASPIVDDMRRDVIDGLVTRRIPPKAYAEQWDTQDLENDVREFIGLDLPIQEWAAEEGIADEEIRERILKASDARVAGKREQYGYEQFGQVERAILLQLLDQAWKDHLLSLDHLRQGINLRAYGQRDPLNEYKREAFELFAAMIDGVREQVTRLLSHVELRSMEDFEQEQLRRQELEAQMQLTRQDPAAIGFGSDELAATGTDGLGGFAPRSDADVYGKVQRNAPCPCGSGKKYKHCHGQV
ncbi:MAG: preprotein translocase subunit SecA [Rhodospirillales bacterium]|nr:preprotein translocase subunit SecA [Rhodospirillales bacterium]